MDFRRSARGARYLTLALARRPWQVRHLPAYVRSRGESLLAQRLPWLSFDLIKWLDSNVGPDTRVFEFGGGGSTAWLADKGATVTSVEHDSVWAAHLRTALASSPRVDVIEKPADNDYVEYVRTIDAFEDETFDLVLVDGRSRVACVRHAAAKVKRGGYLILDDSERSKYAEAFSILARWEIRRFDGLAPGKPNTSHSTLWRRPER